MTSTGSSRRSAGSSTRGFEHVKIIATGGIDEYQMPRLNPLVDAYGVGTAIANAPVLNFGLDIMEIDGQPIAKRGSTPARSGSCAAAPAGRPSSSPPTGR